MAAKKKSAKKRSVPARKATPKSKPKKASAPPETTNTVSPMLTFKDAGAAVAFYKAAFGAKELYRLGEPSGKIGHVELFRVGFVNGL